MSSSSRAAASTALRYPVPVIGADGAQEEPLVEESPRDPDATEYNATAVEANDSLVLEGNGNLYDRARARPPIEVDAIAEKKRP